VRGDSTKEDLTTAMRGVWVSFLLLDYGREVRKRKRRGHELIQTTAKIENHRFKLLLVLPHQLEARESGGEVSLDDVLRGRFGSESVHEG